MYKEEQRKFNLQMVAQSAKENRRKNELLLQENIKNQDQLKQRFLNEFGAFENSQPLNQIIEYEVSLDNIKEGPTLQKSNIFKNKQETILENIQKNQSNLKQSNLLGNSSLLNEKDISLNYSAIDDEVSKDHLKKDLWSSHPMIINKQYFTSEENEYAIKDTKKTKISSKKKPEKNNPKKVEKKPLRKSLKKSKIKKPPRLNKKPNFTKKTEIDLKHQDYIDQSER